MEVKVPVNGEETRVTGTSMSWVPIAGETSMCGSVGNPCSALLLTRPGKHGAAPAAPLWGYRTWHTLARL